MTYCKDKNQATVSYYKPNNDLKNVVFDHVPITVKTYQNVSSCWRFYGTGDDKYVSNNNGEDRDYEAFATGRTPSYKPTPNGRGVNLYMDNELLFGTGYYYRSNYGVERAISYQPTPGRITGGSCEGSGNQCLIEVTDSLGKKFTDAILCPNGKFTVACEGECPEGFIKCGTSNYPGYYCLPCSEIKAELIAARIAIRRLRNA